jgi:Ca2+-binding RTX toxin-like protein
MPLPRTSFTGTSGDDVVSGVLNGPNAFTGYGWGADVLTGGNRDDVFHLTVDERADFVDGGAGRDTVDYSGSVTGLMINLAEGTTRVWQPEYEYTSCAYTVLSNIENVVGTARDDTIVGNGADNVLNGGDGADMFVFRPGLGHDVVEGFDARNGSEGHDVIRFEGLFRSWEDLQEHIERDGDTWVIHVDEANSITLTGVNGTLDANDFLVL